MKFYRVAHKDNEQGMWYNRSGEFAGRIHSVYSTFMNSKLLMPFDEECVGYLSATESLEQLFYWFPPEDIEVAFQDGYRVMEYDVPEEATKFNQKFKHWLISEKIPPVKVWELNDMASLFTEEGVA